MGTSAGAEGKESLDIYGSPPPKFTNLFLGRRHKTVFVERISRGEIHFFSNAIFLAYVYMLMNVAAKRLRVRKFVAVRRTFVPGALLLRRSSEASSNTRKCSSSDF